MYPLHKIFMLALSLCCLLLSSEAFAHGVDSKTEHFLSTTEGAAIGPFLYFGAKHMVTGYDHLLFLLGVIFFLFRPRDILIYVSLFTLGHSITLLSGVLGHIKINPYLIDAIIAFSIVYKGFDNLGGFRKLLGFQPDTKLAVLVFGLFHGFGLATKLQDFNLPTKNLLTNMLSFNAGVEIGQFIALTFMLTLLTYWRTFNSYLSFSTVTNTFLMSGGFMLLGYQLTAYFISI